MTALAVIALIVGPSLLAGQPFEVGIAYGVAFGLIAVFALWALRSLRYAESAP